MRRIRKSALEMPADVFTSADIIPPIPVLVIDEMLARLRGSGLIDKRQVVDMLLDVRNSIWTPTEFSLAVAPLLDSKPQAMPWS